MRATQALTSDDLIDIVVRRTDDEAWRFGLLLNLREMPEPIPQADCRAAIATFAPFIQLLGRPGSTALVTNDANHIETLWFAWQCELVGARGCVFSALEDAEGWLDAEPRRGT